MLQVITIENEDFEPRLVGAMVLSACGCLNEQRLALVGKGLLQMKDFLVIQPKVVAGMVANCAWIPTNQGGAKIGMVIMKNVEALIMWCHICEREGS